MEVVGLQAIQTLARQESAQSNHFFVGVEHLFVALTQVQDSFASAVLTHHGLASRFVRYSIRESIGRYENRRYWPGFPETPRAAKVLSLAQEYAGDRQPTERELLLAILDENDSGVIRVLRQIGADVAALRRTAEDWIKPLEPHPPEVPIRGTVAIDPDQQLVLRDMFHDYAAVEIIRELRGGYSGARVLLVRPMRVDGRRDAPVVVKLDDRHAVLYERRRYDLHVKDTLPHATARLLDTPAVPDGSRWGGLKYTFVGRVEDTEPLTLREFAMQRSSQELSDILRALFDTFGPAWWLQRSPYRFGAWREYEHVLPAALVVEALEPSARTGESHRVLMPLGAWSREGIVVPGEIVVLNGMVVQRLDSEQGVAYLAAGAQPEAINRSGKIELRGLDSAGISYFRGEVVDHVPVRVLSTRDDLLGRSLLPLEPTFDLRVDFIPSGHDRLPDLPNPLTHIGKLLERQVNGYLSMVHGDLQLGNILVGPRGDPWLIDFASARDGHVLFDWALLEASLLVEVVARLAPPGWEGVWGTLALLHRLNQGDDSVLRERHQVGRMLLALGTIREIVHECLVSPGSMTEYFVALAMISLRLMNWQSETLDGRRLMFLVSALSLAEVLAPRRDSLAGEHQLWAGTTDMDRTELGPEK